MRKNFPGYYPPTEEEFKELWDKSIFVLDTNVLLNLYSYPETIREVFFSVFKKIDSRLWIPYQVGLEFHRNKFNRIKQSNQKILKLVQTIKNTGEELNKEVQNIELEKRNIGISDIQDRLQAVKVAHDKLSEAVELACDKLPSISLVDPIGDRVAELLENKMGERPATQKDLDDLVSDGNERYSKEVPPGYLDVKEKGETTFQDRNITYLRKFGDLILWKQILAHVKKQEIKHVVFITGDRKKDWWWMDDGKTIGPLPDLVQEIKFEVGTDLFWMYTADQFLEYAEKYIQATEVTQETIAQVKEISESDQEIVNWDKFFEQDVSKNSRNYYFNNEIPETYSMQTNNSPARYYKGLLDTTPDNYVPYAPEEAVMDWLKEYYSFDNLSLNSSFPDILMNTTSGLNGFEIRKFQGISQLLLSRSIDPALIKGLAEIKTGRLNRFTLIGIIPEGDLFSQSFNKIFELVSENVKKSLNKYPMHSFILGTVHVNEFRPLIIINNNYL